MSRSRQQRVLAAAIAYGLFWAAPAPVAQAVPDYAGAEALIRQGQWDQGIALLKQILQAQPANLKAFNLMGIALTGKGDVGAANQQFKHAVQIDPHFYPALRNLAINEFGQKDIWAAQKHLTEAVALAPNDPMIHAYLGEIAYSRREYRTAANHWTKSGELQKDPSVGARLVECYLETGQQQRGLDVLHTLDPQQLPPQTQFSLGLSLAKHELYQQAIPYFQTVSGKYPDSYDAAFNLAICLVQTKEFPKAIEVLGATAGRGHKTAELDNLLAEAYEGNNQIQEAINALREATRLAPEDEDSYVDLATMCTTYEAYVLGLEVIEIGLRHHPQSDRLIFQRGVIHAIQNQLDLAEPDFQLAAKLAPEKNLSYVAMGVSYMQSGDLPKAIASVRQRIKQKPNDAILHYLLGEALVRSGASPGDSAFTEAKASLEKSVKLNPRFAPAQVNLGKIYLKENRLDDALSHLEEARALDPKDKSAYSQLAIVYRRKGKPEIVKTMLTKLNQLNDEERQEEGHRKRLRGVEETSSQPESPQETKQ
jgi:tetratricopeptide (TPR) repeat protein